MWWACDIHWVGAVVCRRYGRVRPEQGQSRGAVAPDSPTASHHPPATGNQREAAGNRVRRLPDRMPVQIVGAPPGPHWAPGVPVGHHRHGQVQLPVHPAVEVVPEIPVATDESTSACRSAVVARSVSPTSGYRYRSRSSSPFAGYSPSSELLVEAVERVQEQWL